MEQSFPEVSGIVLPLRDPATGRTGSVRLRKREAAARRAANEARLHELTETFRLLDIDPIVLGSSDQVGHPRELPRVDRPPANEAGDGRVMPHPDPDEARAGARRRRGGARVRPRRGSCAPAPTTTRPRRSAPIAAAATLSPRVVLFGDTLTATVDVVVDRTVIDPDAVEVQVVRRRLEAGGDPGAHAPRLRLDRVPPHHVRARCLAQPCVPVRETEEVQFDAARVSYAAPVGEGTRRLTVDAEWPPLVVHSRLAGPDENRRDVLASPWRADLLSLPAVSYRVSPWLLLAPPRGRRHTLRGRRRGHPVSACSPSASRPRARARAGARRRRRSSRRSRCSRRRRRRTAARTGGGRSSSWPRRSNAGATTTSRSRPARSPGRRTRPRATRRARSPPAPRHLERTNGVPA